MTTSGLSGCGAGAGHNGSYGFPLWGKLSPQVTDEGAICGDSQFARRGEVTPPYRAIKITPRGRGGASPARGFAAARKSQISNVGRGLDPSLLPCGNATCRENATGEQCSPLQPNRQICGNRTISRRGEVTPPYRAIKYTHNKQKDAFASFFALYQLYKIIPRPLFRGRSCAPLPTKFCGPRCFAHQNGCRRFPPTAWCRPRGWWAGSSKSYPPRCRSRGPRAG